MGPNLPRCVFLALMVTDTAFFRNSNYHLASDSIDTLDFVFMAQLVRTLELALVELPPLPIYLARSRGGSAP
jgi:hypothetical protein